MNDFIDAGRKSQRNGFLPDLWLFLRDNKKWWLLPFIVTVVLFALVLLLASTGAAPFIYTVF